MPIWMQYVLTFAVGLLVGIAGTLVVIVKLGAKRGSNGDEET